MHKLIQLIRIIVPLQALQWNYYPPGALYYKPPVFPTEMHQGDHELVNHSVQELHDVYSATDLNECFSCKMRLQIGKFLALTRPDLVPLVFTQWCREEGFSETSCQINFGYPALDYSSVGNEFVVMLQEMSPEGYDGDLFCYYHDDACHVLPEPPTLSMGGLWPPKPRLYDAPKPQGETFNVLHISDMSLQLDYEMLSESNCSQTVCCASHSFNKEDPPADYDYSSIFDSLIGLSFYDSTYQSGHFSKGPYIDQYKNLKPGWLPCHEFGSYQCDSPELLVNNTLQTIRDFHENHLNFEFGIFTGGMVSHHDDLFVDKESVLESQYKGYRNMKHYLENFPIFSALGTRDNFPMNQLPTAYAKGGSNYQWQFDFVADLWQELNWIDLEAAKQIRYNKIGYSIVTKRGLKIISLNSNAWNTDNLYSFIDTLNFDPFNVWSYLIGELVDSEQNDQRVWIIAHLPPSTKSLTIPANAFIKIVERFSPKVIAAIFFGYNTKDQFQLIYSIDDVNKDLSNLINYALIGPSISPLGGSNPSWRYYSVDTETFDIVNSFTYYTKLNETYINNGAEPVWNYGYLARDAFDTDQLWSTERPLDAEFWHHAAEKIRDRPDMNKKYTSMQFGYSPFSPYYNLNSSQVDDSIVQDNDEFCKITSFTLSSRKACMITEDQDNFIQPAKRQTFIPHVKPYTPPEYILYQPLPEEEEPMESPVYIDRELPGFYDDESDGFKEKGDETPLVKKPSIRDKVHADQKKIRQEIGKRNLSKRDLYGLRAEFDF